MQPEMANHFELETPCGDHKNRPVSVYPLKYYLLLLAKLK